MLFDDGIRADDVTVEWGRNLDLVAPSVTTVTTHSEIDGSAGGDAALFAGYLSAPEGDAIGVDIGGLGTHFRSYDVYVYLDADDETSRFEAEREERAGLL